MSTSGSTGSVKFVKLSGNNLHSNAASIVEYLELDERSRAITSLKPNYSYGLSIINSHLAAGGSLVLTEMSVTDSAFWPTFVARGADSLSGVPYTYELLDRQGIKLSEIEGLRYATQAGGKLAPHLVRKFAEDAIGSGRRFFVMYGQTEAAPRISYLPPDKAADWPDCIGVPIPGGSIEILDDEGRPVLEPEIPGQLAYRGPNVMMGYALGREDLARDETPAFLMTGDIALRNSDGLFKIVGRSARFVKPFGVRINLDEVEQWIGAHVAPNVCVGNDDRILVLFPAEDSSGVAAATAAKIATVFKLPPGVVQCRVVDAIPKLENGKTDYRKLRELYLSPAAEAPMPKRAGDLAQLVFSRAFLSRSYEEALNILGLKKKEWDGIEGIFKALLGVDVVHPEDCFSDLAGDSLTYVQVALAVEEYLGRLPDGWEYMSVIDLEAANATASL